MEPYPTRFPSLSDVTRDRRDKVAKLGHRPEWLEVLRPRSLPIEPLPGSQVLNKRLWNPLLCIMREYSRKEKTFLAIGKPSRLALMAIEQLHIDSMYDAMDDFPAFYRGLSRLSMRITEERLVASVGHLVVSSTLLAKRWRSVRPDLQLIRNGLDPDVLPPALSKGKRNETKILGYLGTIGAWFDWEWLVNLAENRPGDSIRLIGPIFTPSPLPLPANVEIRPPLGHEAALLAMRDFDVGLIPFKRTELTASVDPIKYYEYRSLGLPVVSTDFGEMSYRGGEEGVFLSKVVGDAAFLIEQALASGTISERASHFKEANSWTARFSHLRPFDLRRSPEGDIAR
ncbi:hypothetical protein [Rhizobium sp. YTU87027]|uniref:hypothetical protein n=1 Tax=Rhizobium sp. YTU87027 TaxID=3417741 RepID=UPI003D68CB91